MLYGLETVSLRKRQESELEVAELKMLKFSLGVTRLDRIRNEYIRGTAHVGRLGDKVREARLRWFGYVHRRETPGDVLDFDLPVYSLPSLRFCFRGGRRSTLWFAVGDAASPLVGGGGHRLHLSPALPPLGGVSSSSGTEVVTRRYWLSVDVTRRDCSAVDVALRCCSAVDVSRLCCSAVDVSQLGCLAVDVARRLRSVVDVATYEFMSFHYTT
ncbi:hypothetical protein QTP70_003237 [Hemibagrus guttatus]|uniref:Uncharacterized protein n=1 Tax=Hemibagrus guttatus TaxID=175788 RepID=A0AAE0Q6Z0_9TELE|nr:hypothetical protein QTP70_003237 [Hemibagrus guttatus]